jgi:hypothetical protein
MAENRLICEIKISQVYGTDEHESEVKFQSAIPSNEDIHTVIQMLRNVADEMEEEAGITRIKPD